MIPDLLLPPAFARIARRMANRRRSRPVDPVLKRNGKFHDVHKGERCFLLATGPSISRQDLTALEGETCIALNNFFVHKDFALINPKYYCVAAYHEPVPLGGWLEWLEEMEAASTAETHFFALTDKERIETSGTYAARDVSYLQQNTNWEYQGLNGFDLTRGVPGPQSVAIMGLQIALYMGFSEIYLIGYDHDWILHQDRSVHFYDESENAMMRHGYNEWHADAFDEYCQTYVELWKQYRICGTIARNNGQRIFNASAGGLLDLFPVVELESVTASST